MKRIQFAFVAIMATIFSIQAQQLENSTLWKIEGNGLKKPSYLFGTIHITCNSTLEADVLKALDQTERVVLELDMDDPDLQSKMMKDIYMKDGKSLKDFVSEAEYATIDSLFKTQLGMSVKFMDKMKPFFLSASFYPKMIDCPTQSFETELMRVAQEQGESIEGLETVEEQMQVFEDIPYEAQIKDLVRMAKDNLAYDKAQLSEMLKVYKSEDITAMLNMMDDENYITVAAHKDKLLENRNKNWIPKISKLAKEQPTFFGVGAGHLAGKNGVINLLRDQGYNVTPVLN